MRFSLFSFLQQRAFEKIPINMTFKFAWWSGGAMVLGKLPVPGRPTNLD